MGNRKKMKKLLMRLTPRLACIAVKAASMKKLSRRLQNTNLYFHVQKKKQNLKHEEKTAFQNANVQNANDRHFDHTKSNLFQYLYDSFLRCYLATFLILAHVSYVVRYKK